MLLLKDGLLQLVLLRASPASINNRLTNYAAGCGVGLGIRVGVVGGINLLR